MLFMFRQKRAQRRPGSAVQNHYLCLSDAQCALVTERSFADIMSGGQWLRNFSLWC